MKHSELIEEYLQEITKQKPKADIKRLRGYITQSTEYFSAHGVETPAEKDYTALREYFYTQPNRNGGNLGEDAVQARVREARNFYAWCEEHGPADMGGCIAPAEEKERGRPVKVYSDGETAKRKYSLSMPLSVYEALKDLADFTHSTMTDIMIELAREYVERNAQRLEIFRKAQADAEALLAE